MSNQKIDHGRSKSVWHLRINTPFLEPILQSLGGTSLAFRIMSVVQKVLDYSLLLQVTSFWSQET